ncbi:hypothetical protein [Deinococcus aquatilis]|uniref:hypothetical protein n=1 Tax=Deinococcus aquatilis TaxID=519440 RepID=UPI0012FA1448|nr:hypothetical protein [Deinococcus aquatilis]
MANIPIKVYGLIWSPHTHLGGARIVLQNDTVHNIVNLPAAEFAALAAILNESPIFFNPANGEISTNWEPVGGT